MAFKVIDVSKYQKAIDFNKVKENGYKGAIIRAAYRGWGKAGTIVTDPYFFENVSKCKAAGLPYGVYFFSQATNTAEAIEEAAYTINLIEKTGCIPEYPVYIDSEYGNALHTGRADKLAINTRTSVVKAFCDYVEKQGYYSGIYASTSWLNSKLSMTILKPYDVWVAHYASKCGYKGAYGMWQYTSKGKVPGITGNCDVSWCYKDYPSIIKNNGLNGFNKPAKHYTFTVSNISEGDKNTFIDIAKSLNIMYNITEV